MVEVALYLHESKSALRLTFFVVLHVCNILCNIVSSF